MTTDGPPVSIQWNANAPSTMSQHTATRPVSFDRAPYFAAFVASSWMASDKPRACWAFSPREGPLASILRSPAWWGDGGFDDLADIRFLEARPNQKILCPCQRRYAGEHGLAGFFHVGCLPQGLSGDRLHHRQQVLHAMRQLLIQDARASSDSFRAETSRETDRIRSGFPSAPKIGET